MLRRALVIPDCHRPFHDRRAYALALEVAVFLGIHEVVILGDYADFYAVSRHRKDPRVKTLLLDEVESVNQGLDELDRLFPEAKRVFLEGNHELRLESYLVEQAPALFGVTSVQHLFGLERRGWKFQSFGRDQAYPILESGLFAFHRPQASSPKLHIQKCLANSIYGDIHKIELAHAVSRDKRFLTAACPGWLGDVNSRVFDYMPNVPQWQLGFAIVSKENSSADFHIEIGEIKNKSCVFGGKLFKA